MAGALENVFLVEKLPRLLKPLDLPALQNFFNEKLAQLIKKNRRQFVIDFCQKLFYLLPHK
jgi:hypothetical protein